MSAPVTMLHALRVELIRLGWSDHQIDRMTWGRCFAAPLQGCCMVSGSPEGMTLECPYRQGHTFYVSGPFASVRVDDFVAIVRYG